MLLSYWAKNSNEIVYSCRNFKMANSVVLLGGTLERRRRMSLLLKTRGVFPISFDEYSCRKMFMNGSLVPGTLAKLEHLEISAVVALSDECRDSAHVLGEALGTRSESVDQKDSLDLFSCDELDCEIRHLPSRSVLFVVESKAVCVWVPDGDDEDLFHNLKIRKCSCRFSNSGYSVTVVEPGNFSASLNGFPFFGPEEDSEFVKKLFPDFEFSELPPPPPKLLVILKPNATVDVLRLSNFRSFQRFGGVSAYGPIKILCRNSMSVVLGGDFALEDYHEIRQLEQQEWKSGPCELGRFDPPVDALKIPCDSEHPPLSQPSVLSLCSLLYSTRPIKSPL